jgi:hypothetical protein
MHTEMNTSNEIAALTIKGYRSSFDIEANQLTIGGPSNFLFVRDLKMRPYKNKDKTQVSRIIDAQAESSVLLAALEMEAEREAAMRQSSLRSRPKLAPAILSFNKETAPAMSITEGLMRRALHYLDDSARSMSELQAPPRYRGSVRRILQDSKLGLTVIELTEQEGFDPMSLVVELPSWGEILVSKGQEVFGGQPLAMLSLPSSVLDSIYSSNGSIDEIWEGVESYVGEQDALMILNKTWFSEVTHWAGMTMIPNYLLDKDQVLKANGVWRDLSQSLNRVCHSHRNPSEIIRHGPREGKISVWDGYVSALSNTYSASGPVDMVSLPDNYLI